MIDEIKQIKGKKQNNIFALKMKMEQDDELICLPCNLLKTDLIEKLGKKMNN